MKRKFVCILGLAIGSMLFSTKVSAQPVAKGNFTIDAYYGFPNMMTSILKVVARALTTDPNIKIDGLGTFGGRIQYMVTDHIGLGLEGFYAKSSVTYLKNETDSLGFINNYSYTITSRRPRFLFRFDYHFGTSSVVDPYFAAGLGVNAGSFRFSTTAPFFDKTGLKLPALIPVAYRIAFGTKFYFLKNLGAGAEIGLGGPLITVGLSGKF